MAVFVGWMVIELAVFLYSKHHRRLARSEMLLLRARLLPRQEVKS